MKSTVLKGMLLGVSCFAATAIFAQDTTKKPKPDTTTMPKKDSTTMNGMHSMNEMHQRVQTNKKNKLSMAVFTGNEFLAATRELEATKKPFINLVS